MLISSPLIKWSVNFCDLNFHCFGKKLSIDFVDTCEREVSFELWRTLVMARFLDFSLDPRLGKESSKKKSFYYAFNNVPVVSTRFVSLWASRSFPSFWNATLFALISLLWMSFSIKLAFISDNKVSCCPNAFCTYYIRRRGQEKGTKTIKLSEVANLLWFAWSGEAVFIAWLLFIMGCWNSAVFVYNQQKHSSLVFEERN